MEQVKTNEQVIVVKEPESGNFPIVDLNQQDLPDLRDAEVMPIELTTLYWTPEIKGEEKRVYFDSIQIRQMPALNEADAAAGPQFLPCAYFFEQGEEGIVRICNASKRLVAALEGNFVKRGTPLIITYLGKVKNNTNAFKSDSWSVRPLNPKMPLIAEKVQDDIAQNGNKTEMGFGAAPAAEQTPAAGSGTNSSAAKRPNF